MDVTLQSIVVLGSLEVDIAYEDEMFTLPLIVGAMSSTG